MRSAVGKMPWPSRYLALLLLTGAMTFDLPPALAQASYLARFEMAKSEFLLGEPILCDFVIRNTGSQTFSFLYRSPSRVLERDHEQEPHFSIRNSRGTNLRDPAPLPCGGVQGTVVYGSVTLPAGQTHTERWLLNQWGEFTAPGRFQVRAERRLELRALDPQTGKEKPAAFALALDELSFEVKASTRAQLETVFKPYLDALRSPKDPNPAEAVLVVTTLPRPFLLGELEAMSMAAKPDRWDRRDALDGLARLDTAAAWDAVLKVARGATLAATGRTAAEQAEDPVRSHAVLLLSEKAEPRFLPTLDEILHGSAEPLRGDILRGLGFFHDPAAYRTLFENLHSERVTDRMNCILALKNLATKEVISPLIAMLKDPEPQVRQVANFALVGVTKHALALPTNPSPQEWARAEIDWHTWWRENGGSFTPPHPPACHEW